MAPPRPSAPLRRDPDALPDAEAALTALVDRMQGVVARGAAFVGIYSGGAWLAERLAERLPGPHTHGLIDVYYYSDDNALSGLKPNTRRTSLPSRTTIERSP